MEDPSVEVAFLNRKEILKRLDLESSHYDTGRLKVNLKNLVKRNHPIHNYLSQLSHEHLKELFMNIYHKSSKSQYEKMKKAMANEMFNKFPKAPLTTLVWILKNGKIPTEMEFDFILKELSENSSFDHLHREDVVIAMSSNNAKSPEAEMNFVNKKAENNDADNSNSSSKRMKIDVNEGIRNPHSSSYRPVQDKPDPWFCLLYQHSFYCIDLPFGGPHILPNSKGSLYI